MGENTISKICIVCGRENPNSATFCSKCGGNIDDNYEAYKGVYYGVFEYGEKSTGKKRKDTEKIPSKQKNNPMKKQSGSSKRQFNLQIRETTMGTFGHDKSSFNSAVVKLTGDELIITKKGTFTGRDRGNITLRYLDMISLDEDRGWVLTTVQIRMGGNHTVNLRSNKEEMRNFFTVLKQAVDTCKKREQTKEIKAHQINSEPKINNSQSEDPVDKLVKLAKLLEDGLIDENEFAALKANILKKA